MKYFDDDMDELFNKAGSRYPLKTEPGNWEAVRAALVNDGTAVNAKTRGSWRRLLPLLLLLLIPAVYLFTERQEPGEQQSAEQHSRSADIHAREKNNVLPGNSGADDAEKTQLSLKTGNHDRGALPKKTISGPEENQTSAVVPDQKDKPVIRNNNQIAATVIDNKKSTRSFKKITPSETGTEPTTIAQKENITHITRFTEPRIARHSEEKYNPLDPYTSYPSIRSAIEPAPSEVVSLVEPVGIPGNTNSSRSVPLSDKKRNINKKGLYYGVMAAPDFTTVKGQNIKKAGYSAGIIAGFNLSARWALEAGALWSNKKYFTKGEYFDKSGAQIPAAVDVHWLDGECNMFEFPIVVRYHFSTKKNSLFASAGLTSYMMREEYYTYGAVAGPGNNYYEGYRSYDRSGDHLFSNLQLSAGYKFSLSPKINVRFEPYLKAPVKKIGIGKMPITSTGLYFSITRDFR